MDSFFSIPNLHTQTELYRNIQSKDPYTEETREKIIKRIMYLCRLRKINTNTLAMRSGLTPSTLKSILYGKSKNPGIVTLRHICDGLDISLEEFFHSVLFREW